MLSPRLTRTFLPRKTEEIARVTQDGVETQPALSSGRGLWDDIYRYLLSLTKELNDAVIEFVFSAPTTWLPQGDKIKAFEEILNNSAFNGGKKHSVKLGLTEAEAVAVHTASCVAEPFKICLVPNISREPGSDPVLWAGQVILVCDVGGGTTVAYLFSFLSLSMLMVPPGHFNPSSRRVTSGIKSLFSPADKPSWSESFLPRIVHY